MSSYQFLQEKAGVKKKTGTLAKTKDPIARIACNLQFYLLGYSSSGILLVDAYGTVGPMMIDPCANKQL